MKKLALALLALATALAITPAALADTIATGSSFTVNGNLSSLTSNTPTLSNVSVQSGTGTFADITPGFLTVAQIAADISLNSNVIGDTFTFGTSDGQTITFTVTSVVFGPNHSAYGIGTLTDTGVINYAPVTLAFWEESIATAGQNVSFTFDTDNPVPEPSSLLLLGTGLLTVAGALRRKLAR